MIWLVFTACLQNTPETIKCREHTLMFSDVPLLTCVLGAQGMLAQWVNTHPNHYIVRWECAHPNRLGQRT